ncbi:CBS domain-containing protein [Streptomyces sp. NPDC007863]|uniref:CBS domain-containing protein n=1 Tax=Streptomyces sp. NPDC007863 TaxID=3154894 RepID=UPI0033F87482
MTVEVALAVMSGARTAHLAILDADGRRTGLVTRAQLAGFRASAAYTDRVRLSELAPAGTTPRP